MSNEIKICELPTCSNPLIGKQRKFCSAKCKGASSNSRNQNYAAQKLRSLSRKLEFVKMKGGKCERCGYCKNLAGLCFHHTDGTDKDFTLDSRRLSNASMDTLLLELQKCVLLCHNCHMEVHYPDLDMVGAPGLEPETAEL